MQEQNQKKNKVINAFIIGFAVGIIIFSIIANSIGFFTLIPLFIIYKLVNKKDDSENE